MLTKKYLLTFREGNTYENPTEVIEMTTASTVKSADEETMKENSFVSALGQISPSQKLEVNGVVFYMYAETYNEKESWIGALGRAMIKTSVLIDNAFDNDYM